VHGVLQGFRERELPVHAYAAASSSAIPAAYAAMDLLDLLDGTAYWELTSASFAEHGDISASILATIDTLGAAMKDGLYMSLARRFVLAASRVVTPAAAEACQGSGAKKLGLEQLRAARTRDRSWAAANLELRLFDTMPNGRGTVPLMSSNLADVFYATTRMLHAWKEPAWVDNEAYIDASYTCSCPAQEMAALGYERVIAISPEPGPFWHDLYQDREIPRRHDGATIALIQPAINLQEIGVDYLSVDPAGGRRAFEMGREAGLAFDPEAAFSD
jgi:hypothetical protein